MKIGWFTSGKDKGAYDMLDRVINEQKKGLDIQIQFLFCNIEEGAEPITDKVLQLAKRNKIKVITFSSAEFEPILKKNVESWRRMYDRKIQDLIEPYGTELLVFAGYGLLVSKQFCDKNNIINIHPSTPNGPKGSLKEVVERTMKTKSRVAGVMSHIVTEGMDEGQSIMYASFMLTDPTNAESVRNELLRREPDVLFYTLKALSSGVIQIKNKKVMSGEAVLFSPIALTKVVK